MLNFVVLALLIVAAALLVWWGIRSWRRKTIARKSGAAVAFVLSAVLVVVGGIMSTGLYKIYTRSAPTPNIQVAGSDDQVARGRAIADGFCGACHSKTGLLAGGLQIGDDFPVPVGSFVSSNLTPAGDLPHWSDGQIFRAIRNSVDADGHWLVVMSYTNASRLSDDDIKALIAFIRSIPAAGQKTPNPPDRVNPLGVAMLGAGMLPSGKPVSTATVTAPPKGATLQFGEYILSYQDCRECHGTNLTGGRPGQLGPLGPDLNLVKGWKLQEFISTMRTGTDPNGHQLSKEMPWRPIGKMDDEELAAVYDYLIQLPGS
jgi:mono/diheme cytochrome c family protein